MLLTLLAMAIALFSVTLMLAGLPMVLRDTALAVAGVLQPHTGRTKTLAFVALWVLIFWLSLG